MLAIRVDKVSPRSPAYKKQFDGFYASAKIDGLRATVQRCPSTGEPRVYTRTLREHPNPYIQQMFGREEFLYFDGEITEGVDFHRGSGTLRSATAIPKDPRFWVFDLVDTAVQFSARLASLEHRFNAFLAHGNHQPRVRLLTQRCYTSACPLDTLCDLMIAKGAEGVCLRDPAGFYKEGRSTAMTPWLIKLKGVALATADVIGWEPLMRNDNPVVTAPDGARKRTSHTAGLTADYSQCGVLIAHCSLFDTPVRIGSGFTLDERLAFARDLPRKVSFKYQPQGSTSSAPRHAVFTGTIES